MVPSEPHSSSEGQDRLYATVQHPKLALRIHPSQRPRAFPRLDILLQGTLQRLIYKQPCNSLHRAGDIWGWGGRYRGGICGGPDPRVPLRARSMSWATNRTSMEGRWSHFRDRLCWVGTCDMCSPNSRFVYVADCSEQCQPTWPSISSSQKFRLSNKSRSA